MKSRLLSVCLLAALSLAGTQSFARELRVAGRPASSQASYKTEANDCNVPTSQFSMDVNNVRTTLLDAGDLWFNTSTSSAAYEVPKGDRTSATAYPQAIFAGAIWVSGLDQGNNLKIAALTYRSNGTDYYSGPLSDNGTVSLATCNLWDQHFPVWGSQIKPVISAYQAALLAGGTPGSITVDLTAISDSVKYWPGKGNPLLTAKGYDMTSILAPFYDADGDGIYNPAKGDYPTIKHGGINSASLSSSCGSFDTSGFSKNSAYADQMVFWVTNDKGNVHNGTSSGVPIGIQINNLAFAFQTSDEINNMTFYTYNIINKSGAVLNKTYMSQYVDVDLGCPNNDAVGCDTSRSLGIMYNGKPQGGANTPGHNYVCDEGIYCNNGTVGYGCDLPMLGIDFFEGPTDTSRIPDPAHPGKFIHKQLGLTAFESYTNSNTPTGDPSTSVQFRNYQTGYWKDGTPVTFGGNGYQGSTQQTSFMYPGDPSIATQWSECNSQIAGVTVYAGDRRFVQTSGPFTFLPCASENITIGVVFVQPTGGVGTNCPSFSLISVADDKAQALFDAKFNAITGPSAPKLSIRELNQKVIINIEDDPAGNNVGESYNVTDPLRVRKGYVPGSGLDSAYKFQGYIIYQLATDHVSVNDLTDPSKAVPVAVYDIADNVSHLVNWNTYLDQTTGITNYEHDVNTIPGVGLDLPNTGIKHSLIDSMDLIGGGQMVNHQTYYFGVLSFATNNFKTFNPDSSKGQSVPFLKGGFASYSAIPSDPTSENGGRILNTYWGASSEVKRLEGQGNGGNYIDLTPETIKRILASPLNYTDTLDYTVGLDPIGLKVTDPILLKEADFELKIHDTLYNGTNVSTSAYWILKDLTNNVEIPSVRSLIAPYEQIISTAAGEDYGFSITLGTPFPIYTNFINNAPVYGAIGGSISFADTTQPWLSFVADTSANADPKNWIRSGQTFINCNVQAGITPDPFCNVFSDAYFPTGTGQNIVPHFTDPNSAFDHIAGGKWAPYCLGANWSLSNVGGNQVNAGARPQTVGGPSFKWDKYNDMASSPRNNLDKLQSVDIVLTSDKSLWSKCVVFETGENPEGADLDPNLTGKAPRKGMLRGHYSLNLDGTYSSDQTGQSYFPGYAINVETGQRLEVAFGEASDEHDQNGRDMIWNPTSTVLGSLNNGNAGIPFAPIFAGRHYLYILDTPYPTAASGVQPGDDIHDILTDPTVYGSMVNNPVTQPYSAQVISIYDHIMWTAMPYVTPGFSLKSYADGLIPTDVTIKLRVQKPYAKFGTNVTPFTTEQDSLPRYVFSTKGKGVTNNNDSVAKTALDMIRVVPNPYYAFSSYETSANDSRVKITNVPNNCSIKIFTLDGVLVRTLSRSVGADPTDPTGKKLVELSDGKNLASTEINQDNTIDWDLKNEKNIPVASGIYLFDVNVPGVGHKTLKWFGAMRPTDISNF